MRVRIAQCLCPERHCIAAIVVWESDKTNKEIAELLEGGVSALIHGHGHDVGASVDQINAHCGICGSPHTEWSISIGWSKEFESLEQAKGQIELEQERQFFTQTVMYALGTSYDARKKTKKAELN